MPAIEPLAAAEPLPGAEAFEAIEPLVAGEDEGPLDEDEPLMAIEPFPAAGEELLPLIEPLLLEGGGWREPLDGGRGRPGETAGMNGALPDKGEDWPAAHMNGPRSTAQTRGWSQPELASVLSGDLRNLVPFR